MKENASTYIKEIIKTETDKIRNTFSGPSYHAVQHILRRLDFVILFYTNHPRKTDNEIDERREFYNYGWAPALKPFYTELNINTLQPYPEMYKDAINWADCIIQYSGHIAFLNQLVDYEKADLIKLSIPKENEISFSYRVENAGIEFYDRKSHDFYRDEIIERIIDEKKRKDNLNEEEIKLKLKEIIRNPKGKYISYDSTPEIEEYYRKKGHYFILKLQGYDEFGEEDVFGGIEYRKYLDIVETLIGNAIMHTEACLELAKMNPNVDLQNLLTYTHFKDKTIDIYKNYFGATKIEIEQIFSCITLNKENFNYYLEYPGASLPMYVQVSDNMLVRLISGCLSNPFELLNRELKRKFEKDYFKAVNKREERFRRELFHLFPYENVIKIPKGINIKIDGRETDIDVVLFDVKTMTLGLFQLKWQDPFMKSMKERFSRITNLFQKATQWIQKVEYWLTNTEPEIILKTLDIKKYYKGEIYLTEVHLFVLSRNNMNFTNVDEMDDRVAWGTWYQMIESQAIVKNSSDNVIRDAFTKLKILSPKNRMKKDRIAQITNFEARFGKYRIYYDKQN